MQNETIEQKENVNILLEEMRQKEQMYLIRHGLDTTLRRPIEDKERAYWQKVKNSAPKNPFQQVADAIRTSGGPTPDFDKPWMKYNEARLLFLECMQDIARQHKFTWDYYPSLKRLCQLMAGYFSGWNVDGELDLAKGFFIYGPCGCGKSKLMAAAQLMAYRVGRSERVYNRAACERITKDPKNTTRYQKGNWYFDDLGNTDLVFKDWGREVNPFQEIFTERAREMEVNYIVTHVTSNIKPESFAPVTNSDGEEIKRGVFDARVISRWNAMFNFYELDGPDYR